MKVLYATDLHGQVPKFECVKKILDDHELLIIGADLLPKGIMASDRKIKEFIDRYLYDFFYHVNDIPIIVDFGNDDWMMYYDMFKNVVSQFYNVFISHHNRIEIGRYVFTGINYVPDYPFGMKDLCRRDGSKISDPEQIGIPYTSRNGFIEGIGDLDRYLSNVPTIYEELNMLSKPNEKTVYLIHPPPFGSGLDKCHRIGPVGSVDVRKWIEEKSPWLTLHGHIHESYELTGVCINKINDTICINPGQKYKTFVWCEFDLRNVAGTFLRKEMRE